jgi:hypothetical protein
VGSAFVVALSVQFAAFDAWGAEPAVEPSTSSTPNYRPSWQWGGHVGLEVGSLTRSQPQYGDLDGRPAHDTNAVALAKIAALLQWPLSQRLSVGPTAAFAGLVDRERQAWNAELGLLARLTPWPTTRPWRATYSLGFGASLNAPSAPPSFSIEHEIAPALGATLSLASGVERRRPHSVLFIDGVLTLRAQYEHEHRYTDTRTGEATTDKETWSLVTLGARVGVLWDG